MASGVAQDGDCNRRASECDCECGVWFPTQTKLQHLPGTVTISRTVESCYIYSRGGIILYLDYDCTNCNSIPCDLQECNHRESNKNRNPFPSMPDQIQDSLHPSHTITLLNTVSSAVPRDTQCTPRADQSSSLSMGATSTSHISPTPCHTPPGHLAR